MESMCLGTIIQTLYLEEDGETYTIQPFDIEGFSSNDINRDITSFAEDEEGELYVLTSPGPNSQNGRIYKISPATPASVDSMFLH